ncbi:claudin-17-like [Micropterus salmoides]|uniref:claudin-17-like n=1 Tax=Micropterus salmoides TaxID=27706 RepID=UPI0018ECFE58|nr:claudin-17-like [Micropterus salmoides]
MRAKLEVLALVLGFIGLFGTITVTVLPTWRVSAFIGANLIVMEELWMGLWMDCYRQINIRMQCKVYDSVLILPPELQAARGLMCVSIVLVVISLLVTGCGTQKSNCCGDNIKSKNITLALGGSLFLLSFLTTLIPVSWVGYTIISNYYNPTLLDAEKRELGSALFIGWATSGILLITGIILLVSYSKRREKMEKPFTDTYLMAARDVQKEESVYLERTPSSSYKHQQYV